MSNSINLSDYIQKDGTLIIPSDLVPFVKLKEIPNKKQCKECGNEFYPTHKRQIFCQPQVTKRSRCENTYNQRLKRRRKKEMILNEKSGDTR